MTPPPISRRDAILRTFAFSAAALLPASSLVACKKELTCNDTTGLSADDLAARQKTFKYAEPATDQTKTCDGCQQFKAPPTTGACGGCLVVKGSIHPKAGCSVWAMKLS